MSGVNTNICRPEGNTGAPELQQALQQILPDRVQRLAVAEHELPQMRIQLDEVRMENVIIKRSNTQLAGNLEDAETRLAEIQLNLESSHVNDSSIAQGGEMEMLKLKIEEMEVQLEELKNMHEFNDEILQHKEDDIDKLAQKCEDLSQLNSQLMTRLESGPESATLGNNDAAPRDRRLVRHKIRPTKAFMVMSSRVLPCFNKNWV